MVKDSKKKEEKPKGSSFKQFIKKRAPIYLAVIAIVIIFIVPEYNKFCTNFFHAVFLQL